eukprot:6597122-Lingulodinium_polyedra.AAC.1
MRDINVLATEVGVRGLSVKNATPEDVERFLRILQRRFDAAEEAPRLRGPVERWFSNGGRFAALWESVPPADAAPSPLVRHRILAP